MPGARVSPGRTDLRLPARRLHRRQHGRLRGPAVRPSPRSRPRAGLRAPGAVGPGRAAVVRRPPLDRADRRDPGSRRGAGLPGPVAPSRRRARVENHVSRLRFGRQPPRHAARRVAARASGRDRDACPCHPAQRDRTHPPVRHPAPAARERRGGSSPARRGRRTRGGARATSPRPRARRARRGRSGHPEPADGDPGHQHEPGGVGRGDRLPCGPVG